MLVIRLFRTGRKNQPSYKVVVTEKTNPPARGRFVEEVGFYNPLTKEKKLNAERITYWLSVGAKPSDTLYNLLVTEKIVEGTKIPKQKKTKKQAVTEEKTAETVVAPAEAENTETPAEVEQPAKQVEEKPAETEKKEEPVPEPEPKEEEAPDEQVESPQPEEPKEEKAE